MVVTWYLLFLIAVGLALSYLCGNAIAQRRLPLAVMLAWLALCFLFTFVRFPSPT